MNFDLVTSELLALANRPVSQRLRILADRCPKIVAQIQQDSESSGPFDFWGRSVNFDELVGVTIVELAVLETLAAAARLKMSLRNPHAGVQHTYGYLFSKIQTPYGMKRDRWIDDLLELAFGQPMDTFGPEPREGTLLANVTWLAGHFAFRNEPRLSQMQDRLRTRVSSSLLHVGWHQYRTQRFTEHTEFRHGSRRVKISLQTDIVFFGIEEERLRNRCLLVYSTRDSRQDEPELITLFTVASTLVDELLIRAQLPMLSDVRPRYNAYVPGFPLEPQLGSCELTEA